MKKTSVPSCMLITLLAVSLLSCRKDGMHSARAKQIQHRWERISSSSMTDYLDGRPISWTIRPAQPGSFLEFSENGYFFRNAAKFQYKVDGEKILYLKAGNGRFTTPQYTDTSFIKQVDDHLLVLFSRKYFLSPGYSYIDESLDSLKK